jgi:hypothetical protein
LVGYQFGGGFVGVHLADFDVYSMVGFWGADLMCEKEGNRFAVGVGGVAAHYRKSEMGQTGFGEGLGCRLVAVDG